MDSKELTRQRIELQANLNSQQEILRTILNSQSGTAGLAGAVGQHFPLLQQSQLGANVAIHCLPQNSFVLRSDQTGPVSAFQQPMTVLNGQSVMCLQGNGILQGMSFPVGHGSPQFLMMNGANLSVNQNVVSASPIIIVPSVQAIPFQLQGNGQQFPIPHVAGMPQQQFGLPQGSFVQQHLGQQLYLPGAIGQMTAGNNSRIEQINIPEEMKSTSSSQQQRGPAQQVITTRNPLELLAAVSHSPNDSQDDPTSTDPAEMAYASPMIPPSTSDSYRDGKGSKSNHSNNPKPKRPLSAYNIFFRDERAKIIAGELSDEEKDMLQKGTRFEDRHTSSGIKEYRRKQPHRKAGFQELARIIAARWKNIDPDRLQKYEKMSALGRIKYSRDLHIWAQRERKDVLKPIQRLVERNMQKVAQSIG